MLRLRIGEWRATMVSGRKTGSVAPLKKLATALQVDIEDLLPGGD